jgi:hypothetical protein
MVLETEKLSPLGRSGGNMEGTLLSRECEIKMSFCFIKRPCLFRKPGDV